VRIISARAGNNGSLDGTCRVPAGSSDSRVPRSGSSRYGPGRRACGPPRSPGERMGNQSRFQCVGSDAGSNTSRDPNGHDPRAGLGGPAADARQAPRGRPRALVQGDRVQRVRGLPIDEAALTIKQMILGLPESASPVESLECPLRARLLDRRTCVGSVRRTQVSPVLSSDRRADQRLRHSGRCTEASRGSIAGRHIEG
jgi:hypothetical protein